MGTKVFIWLEVGVMLFCIEMTRIPLRHRFLNVFWKTNG